MNAPEPRIPAFVLGATGLVGQRFVRRLADHPWFELAGLAGSERVAGRLYGDAVDWTLAEPLPERTARMKLHALDDLPAMTLAFSALGSEVARGIEERAARAGALVVTNASAMRMDADVPLVVPEVNPDHLALLETQATRPGGVVANPNCSSIGLVLALAPLARAIGVRRVHVVTLQALSGAGQTGLAALAAHDNVLPHIPGEEEKLAAEPRKILGRLEAGGLREASIVVSAQTNRVPVSEGHTLCVSVELEREARAEELIELWREFAGEPQERRLPSAPARPLAYLSAPAAPQPRLHRDQGHGMVCTLGRLAPCPVLGWRFVALVHNTERGAAGGALLTAELAVAQGRLAGWEHGRR